MGFDGGRMFINGICMDSMVMEWNINGMSMGFNSDILEYSWDIDGDIGKNITGDTILITLQ